MLFRFAIYCLFLMFSATPLFAKLTDKYNLSTDTAVNRLAGTKRVYYATRIENRPKIAQKLNDSCWESGIWPGGFTQQIPDQGKNPSQKTEIKLLYDNNNLYVGFKCFDIGPGNIRPILSRRDEMAGDIAGIAIDSYNDKYRFRRNGYFNYAQH